MVALAIGRRSLARFIELEGFDRAMALAGQAFAAMLPLLIVVSAVSPAGGEDLADSLVERFDLKGETAATLSLAVSRPDAATNGLGAFGALVLLLSALSFTRALQRLYVKAWRLDRLGLRGNVWGLLWLLAFSAYWLAQPVVVDLLSGVVAVSASLALSCVLWLFTPWLLVGRTLSWRRLLPQAALTTVALEIFAIASIVYMPRAVATAAREFGFIGVAFALLSWLFVVTLIIVAATALGVTLAGRAESPRACDA